MQSKFNFQTKLGKDIMKIIVHTCIHIKAFRRAQCRQQGLNISNK